MDVAIVFCQQFLSKASLIAEAQNVAACKRPLKIKNPIIMSMETYEAQLRRLEFYQELAISEKQFEEGKTKDARASLSDVRAKYAL